MILRRFVRAFVLALSLCLAPLVALAHARPGSILTFSDDGALTLTVQFTVEDLVIADPALATVFEGAEAGEMSTPQSDAIGAYLADHLSIQDVDLIQTDARFEVGYNDHVGVFIWAVTTFSLPDLGADGLGLRYDAVMHEVRSHRATVYFLRDDVHHGLADFGFRQINGRPPVVEVTIPK